MVRTREGVYTAREDLWACEKQGKLLARRWDGKRPKVSMQSHYKITVVYAYSFVCIQWSAFIVLTKRKDLFHTKCKKIFLPV